MAYRRQRQRGGDISVMASGGENNEKRRRCRNGIENINGGAGGVSAKESSVSVISIMASVAMNENNQ